MRQNEEEGKRVEKSSSGGDLCFLRCDVVPHCVAINSSVTDGRIRGELCMYICMYVFIYTC